MENMEKREHSLEIRNKITIGGVVSVIKIEEREVALKLSQNILVMTGIGFSAERLSLSEGILVLKGEIMTLRYAHSVTKEKLLKKLFK